MAIMNAIRTHRQLEKARQRPGAASVPLMYSTADDGMRGCSGALESRPRWRMCHETLTRRWRLAAALTALFAVAAPRGAGAQGFLAPSFGYNFAGDSGCRSATDCEDKNWNWGGSLGALGSIVGVEFELTYEGEFTGKGSAPPSAVTTLMGNFMLAPRIAIVQPYGVAGIGAIRTKVENRVLGSSESENQVGWTVGGGLIIFVQEHFGF